ncbi:MAG TPA: DinB family protein [Acidobacteriaceae bacterium]
MTVEQLHSLALYNRWANTRLLQAAAVLSDEERERDLGASFGSLQGTLIHILWGERGWPHFWLAGSFVPVPTSGC